MIKMIISKLNRVDQKVNRNNFICLIHKKISKKAKIKLIIQSNFSSPKILFKKKKKFPKKLRQKHKM
jgi:hypothetical protein